MQNAFQRTQRSRMNSSSARVNTLPVGLFGVLRMMALVCGPKAAANSFSSYDQKDFSSAGGRIFPKTGGGPPQIPAPPRFLLKGPEDTNLSPGCVLCVLPPRHRFGWPPPDL